MSLHWENMGSGDTTFKIHYLLREFVFLMWIKNPQLGCTGSQILRSGRSCAAADPVQRQILRSDRSCATSTLFQNQKLKALALIP